MCAYNGRHKIAFHPSFVSSAGIRSEDLKRPWDCCYHHCCYGQSALMCLPFPPPTIQFPIVKVTDSKAKFTKYHILQQTLDKKKDIIKRILTIRLSGGALIGPKYVFSTEILYFVFISTFSITKYIANKLNIFEM